jgi:hypothetical protein
MPKPSEALLKALDEHDRISEEAVQFRIAAAVAAQTERDAKVVERGGYLHHSAHAAAIREVSEDDN